MSLKVSEKSIDLENVQKVSIELVESNKKVTSDQKSSQPSLRKDSSVHQTSQMSRESIEQDMKIDFKPPYAEESKVSIANDVEEKSAQKSISIKSLKEEQMP